MRLLEQRRWTDAGMAPSSSMASVHLPSWLWSVAIHGALVGAMVWSGLTVPRQEAQEVFQWEVQLIPGESPSASSMEVEEASSKPEGRAGESFAERRSTPVKTSAQVKARRETSPATVPQAEPVALAENEVIPIESVAVATATGDSVRATDGRSASTDSSTDTSRDDTTTEVERDDSTASVQEPSGSEFSDRVTGLGDRGELMANIGPPAQSVTSAQVPARRDFGWVGLALRARVEERKRYSVDARLHGWEGRVVIAADILADGRITESRIDESSGNSRLDEDARSLVASVSPLKLTQVLEADRLTVKIPIVFGLH